MVGKSEVGGGQPDVWSQIWGPMRQFGRQVADFFAPSSDASSSEDAYEINVELPGVADADIKIEVHDQRLTISGAKQANRQETGKHYFFSERVYGAFQRSFQLPEDADAEAIQAVHKDGLLTVRAPRRAPQTAGPRQVKING